MIITPWKVITNIGTTTWYYNIQWINRNINVNDNIITWMFFVILHVLAHGEHTQYRTSNNM